MEDKIIILRGPDRVRMRPAVIFGSDDGEGCLNAILFLVANSTEEARLGFGNKIIVRYFEDKSIEVIDFGRGIPVEYNQNEQEYDWNLNFCQFYAESAYEPEFSAGIELCAVQYAAEYMNATIYRGSQMHTLCFEKGYNVGGMKTTENAGNLKGTCIRFRLDDTVFSETSVSFVMLSQMLKCYALTNPGICYEIEYTSGGECHHEVYLYDKFSERLREHSGKNELSIFEKHCAFNKIQKSRECSGSLEVCVAFLDNKVIKEAYHEDRFLKNGSIALEEIEKILCERIKVMCADSGIEVSQKTVDRIVKNISILVHTRITPKSFVRWENGTRTAITNGIFAEIVREEFGGVIQELINSNVKSIEKQIAILNE